LTSQGFPLSVTDSYKSFKAFIAIAEKGLGFPSSSASTLHTVPPSSNNSIMTVTTTTLDSACAFVASFNSDYEAKHYDFETQFWGNKMNLADSTVAYSPERLSSTKQAMEDLLSNETLLDQAKMSQQSLLDIESKSESESGDVVKYKDIKKALDIIIRTMECYIMPDKAKLIRQETTQLESQLEASRNHMRLGYLDPHAIDSVFVEQSSVGLRNTIRTHVDETVRQAAYEQGLQSIGAFVLSHGFCDIIKHRNQLARLMNHDDYYDYKVTRAEGMSKVQLFQILDTLEQGTRPLLEQARSQLVQKYGSDALKPWNTSFYMAGSVIPKLDPYFSFGKAVEMYMTSYANLGIQYEQSEMTLDLLDRPGKYSNGFCHWTKVSRTKCCGRILC
jgi:oligoendopeptidase F